MVPTDSDGVISIDNQSTISVLLNRTRMDARARSKSSNATLDARLRAISHRIHLQADGAEDGAWTQLVNEDGWTSDRCALQAMAVGKHPVLWVKSHQPEDDPKPNKFIGAGNELADEAACKGRHLPTPPNVLIPAGGDQFFIMHDGRMVTSEPASYIRKHGTLRAQTNWGDAQKRGMQGAVMRELPFLHKGTLNLTRMAAMQAPVELAHTVARGSTRSYLRKLWMHRQAMQGCFTHKLKIRDPDAVMYSTLHTDESDRTEHHDTPTLDAGEEGDTIVLDKTCPLCGEGPGTLRHVILTCKHPAMVAIRHRLFGFVHDRMCEAASNTDWARATSTPINSGGCKHPAGWQGSDEHESAVDQWPWLALSGWLLPTPHEGTLNARTRTGRPQTLETAQDLGYRGVVPVCISNILISGKFV